MTLRHTTVSGNSTTNNGGGVDNGNGTTIDLTLNEPLPATATAAQHAAAFDYEFDGRSNFLEYAGQTDGSVPNGGNPVAFTRAVGTPATIVMPYRPGAPDLLYTLERSTTLGLWTPIAIVNSGTNTFTFLDAGTLFTGNSGNSFTFTDSFTTTRPRVFYQLTVTRQ